MDTKKTLQLVIVSAERKLLEADVEAVTAPTSTGEVTILPGHIPLLTRLQTGELVYTEKNRPYSVVISQGFMDITPTGQVTVMVDNAVHEREISLDKAQKAVEEANQTVISTADRRELLMAEASLKRAMLEVRVAQKTKKAAI